MHEEYCELSTIFYELTKPVGHSLEGDIEYYLDKLQNTKGRILEAGVGTGRVLIPLLLNGFIADGVDSSAEMLKQCAINLEKHSLRAELFKQDLAELVLPHKYDAIIMPTGSFCILTKPKAQKTLENFYRHLNDGGKIILDLEMPASFQEGATSTTVREISAHKSISLTTLSEKMDRQLQKVSYINRYELCEGGKSIKTETSRFVLHWYETSDFERQLSDLGYRDIVCEPGYRKKNPEIITFIASK